eukprot:Em0022g861a
MLYYKKDGIDKTSKWKICLRSDDEKRRILESCHSGIEAQFEIIQTGWAEAFNSTGANANDIFQTIGILTYTPGNTRSLFETLVPLAIFIAVLAIQLRYFMFQKVQMTNAANSSLIMLDYFKPCSEANPSTVTAHDWPDTHVVSAAYLVLLLMAVLATPLPMVRRVMYPVITFYLASDSYSQDGLTRPPLLGTQYLNLTTFCNTSGVSSNITGMVFNDQYSPVGSDPSWFGLHKGPILAALVLSLWISAQRYQDHYYTTDHISLGPYDKGSLFLGVSRDDADQSLINASKFLLNHFFKMYGLETCCSMLAIAVAVRIDIYGIFYAMVLGLLMLVPRPPSKVHLVLWTFYLVLHGLLLVVQYAFLLGVPKGGCLYPGTERGKLVKRLEPECWNILLGFIPCRLSLEQYDESGEEVALPQPIQPTDT